MNTIVAIITSSILCLTAAIRPDVAIRWIFLSAILLVGTITYFFPQYHYIGWSVGSSGFFLLVISIIHFLSKSYNTLDRISISLFIFAVFLFVPIASNISNPTQILAFGKNIIQFWGFVPLAALGFIPFQSRKKIVRLIIVVIIIQAIVSIYQAMFIVDWAHRVAGGDSVVGTFGGTPDGGGSSGAQTIFLTVIITVVLTLYISNHIKIFFLIPILITTLIPISLNETKIFFVLLPISLIYLLFTGYKRYPLRTLQVALIGFGLVLIIFTIYFLYLQHSHSAKDAETVSEYTDRMSKSGSGFYIGEGEKASISRLGSIKYWWNEQLRNKNILELLVGHGLGASKSGGVFPGRLADRSSPYYGLMLDRTGLSCLLWDIGIVGTVLFFLIFVAGWSLARKARKYSELASYERSIIWGIECSIVILALSNIYDKYFFTNSGLNAFTLLVFSFVVGAMRPGCSCASHNTVQHTAANKSISS